MQPELKPAVDAIKAGDKARAFKILKTILKDHPSAEGWVLAVQVMQTDDQKIACLKKALEIDPWHNEANRLLLKLEAAESIIHRRLPGEPSPEERKAQLEQIQTGTNPLPELKRNVREMEYQRRQKQRKNRRRFGCLMLILFNMSCSFLSLSLVGMFPGVIGTVEQFLGGQPPVREVQGVRVEEIVENPAATVPPSQSKSASNRQVDVLDHGYNHEYTFEVRSGEEILGYVQFMSLTANAVEENVLILNSRDEVIADEQCTFFGEDGLLSGDSNVSFTCIPNETGIWKLRILGIQDESIGAYFVGVETLGR